MLFSILLLIHFAAFAIYVGYLGLLWPTRGAGPRSKAGLVLGITILVTGVLMVMLKYPNINYYKVVPKTVAFLIVTVINGIFAEKDLSKAAYYALIGLTLGAACIAIFH
ncbi:hypothetical protein [Chitinophaga sp. Cy-1792]|uniref:hypothetical protein n=1 Tax=Chitinophaga sp. Cy-1792 TaxID=2608339 RepID=UPI00141DEC06|nr:hypothetical protein [Chitinophaga sp. Cy-1792]NIG55738.1 hypothetical protein [Chitinophaga sp. Cy-1792]